MAKKLFAVYNGNYEETFIEMGDSVNEIVLALSEITGGIVHAQDCDWYAAKKLKMKPIKIEFE